MVSDSKGQVRVSKKLDFCPGFLGFRNQNSCQVGVCVPFFRVRSGFPGVLDF